MLKKNASDQRKFLTFLFGGDYIAALLDVSFFGHNCLMAHNMCIRKIHRKQEIHYFLSGGDYFEALLCFSLGNGRISRLELFQVFSELSEYIKDYHSCTVKIKRLF